MMLIERDREDWKQAAHWQARRLAADPAPLPNEHIRLGEALARMGDLDRAERAFFAALGQDSYSYAAHRNLAELYIHRKLWPQARTHLEFVVRYFPDTDAGTYAALAEVYRAIGDTGAAADIVAKGLRIFPNDDALLRLAPIG